ncbi:MAG: hypothetical protein OXI60_11795 [Acidiferrobacterales bacterium]|nr:hypothetical protein [Acidiferrobacterales bacterium]
MPRKVINLRHMQDRRDDHVAKFLDRENITQLHVNPAHGVPLPADSSGYDALIIYGGIQSANDGPTRPYITQEIDWITDWLASGRPALGICLGGQLIAKCLGARVGPHPDGIREVGFHELEPVSDSDGFLKAPAHFYQWHGEGFTLPDNCELLARGKQFPNQAYRYQSNTYGLQFHPEVPRVVMKSWLESGSEALSFAGAHSAERQLQDESQYGKSMENWCLDFINTWAERW